MPITKSTGDHIFLMLLLVGKTQGSSCMDGCCRTNLLLSRGGFRNFDPILHRQQTPKQLLYGRNHVRTGELRHISICQYHHVLLFWLQS